MSNTIIKVRPIASVNWMGNKTIRYRNTKDTLAPYYDKTGTIVTGLDDEQVERLGKLLRKDLSPASPFWYDYKVIMMDKDREFNTNNPEHELAVAYLKADKRVANSQEDYDKGLYPYARYVIYDEEQDAVTRNKEFTVKRKAVAAFNDMSLAQMRDVLKLYPGYINLTTVKPDVIEAALYEKLEENPAKFLTLVGDKKLDMKVFLKDLVSAKILRKNKSAFYYGEDFVGHDEESTITYLEDPQHQSLKISLAEQLASSKK